MEFKVIETQEQLDALIGERISRAKESARKEFDGYISPEDFEKKHSDLEKQIEGLNAALAEEKDRAKEFDTKIAEKDAKLRLYETASVKTQVAHELGLSYDAVMFIQGETEEDIRKNAEALKTLIGTRKVPLADPEPKQSDSTDSAYLSLLKNL